MVLYPKQNYVTSIKGLNPKLTLQSWITSKLLFSGRKSKITTFLSSKYRLNNVEFNNQWDTVWSRRYYRYFSTSDSSSLHSSLPLKREQQSISGQKRGCCWVQSQRCCRGKLTCWVVAKQYSAVLRMLQMRQSSSKVNFATSEPSFSFSKLVMVSPPLLLVVLGKKKDKTSRAFRCTDRHIAKLLLDFNAIKSPYDHKVQCPVQHRSVAFYIKPTTAILVKEDLLERQTELCIKGKGQLTHSQHARLGCKWNTALPS